MPGLAQPGGHVVPGGARLGGGHDGFRTPDSGRSRVAKCAVSASASWSRARLSSTAVAPVRQFGDEPGQAQQPQYAVELGRFAVAYDERHERTAVDGSPAARARGSSCRAGTTPETRSVSRLCADCSSQECAAPPSMRCRTRASAARSASSRPVAVSPRYPHSTIWPQRSPRPPSSARIQPSPSLPPAWRAMRSQSRSTSSTADRSPAVARTRWARLVTTTRTARVLGDLVEQPLQRGTGGDQPGQGGADGLGQADGGELPPHQPGLDLLGQFGEGERPVQDDHGQPAPFGRPAHHVGRRREGPAETEDDRRGLGAVQRADVLGLGVLVPGEQHPGGEDHLAAAEHHADVGGLGDMHPAHGPVELAGPGHHLGLPGEHPFQGEDLADRQGGFQGRWSKVAGHGVFPCSGAGRRYSRCSSERVRGSRRPPRPPRRSGTAAGRCAGRWCCGRRPCRSAARPRGPPPGRRDAASGSASSVPGLTSSMPIISPRPRTSRTLRDLGGDGPQPFDEQSADAPGVALEVVFEQVGQVGEAGGHGDLGAAEGRDRCWRPGSS